MMQVPTLSIEKFPDDSGFVDALGNAYESCGFCGISGHAISDEIIGDAYAVLREFFALPADVKQRYHTQTAGARGYTSFGIETAKDSTHPDLKEFWQVGREVMPGSPGHAALLPNVWPTEVPQFQTKLYRLYEALEALGNRVLDALALYLNLTPGYFRDKVDHGNSILRPLHYPPIAQQDTLSLRSAAHEDINLITLLVGSEEPGLEVLARDGQWVPINMQAGTIVVNIGDMMQRLTNHVLPSTTHRVVNSPEAYSGCSRYSIPFFLHPNPEFEIATLPGCITTANPNRYPEPILADDYLKQRLVEIGLM
ncbi:MAG: isopenicillin N synthase family dioxygenase [bacterium]